MSYISEIMNTAVPQKERKTDSNRVQVSVSADLDVLPEAAEIISEFKGNATSMNIQPSVLVLKCLAFYNQSLKQSKAQEGKEKGK